MKFRHGCDLSFVPGDPHTIEKMQVLVTDCGARAESGIKRSEIKQYSWLIIARSVPCKIDIYLDTLYGHIRQFVQVRKAIGSTVGAKPLFPVPSAHWPSMLVHYYYYYYYN